MQFQKLANKYLSSSQTFKFQLLSKINNPEAKRYIEQQILSSLQGTSYMPSKSNFYDYKPNQLKSNTHYLHYSKIDSQYYDLTHSFKKIQDNVFNQISKYHVQIYALQQKCKVIKKQIQHKNLQKEQKKQHKQKNKQEKFSKMTPYEVQITKAEKRLANIKNKKLMKQILSSQTSLSQQVQCQKKKNKTLIQTLNNIKKESSNMDQLSQNSQKKDKQIQLLQKKLNQLQLFNDQPRLKYQSKQLQKLLNIKSNTNKQQQKIRENNNKNYMQLSIYKQNLQKQLNYEVKNKQQFSQQLILFMDNFKNQKQKNKRLLQQLLNFNQKEFPFYNKMFQNNFFQFKDLQKLQNSGVRKNEAMSILAKIEKQIKRNNNVNS